MRIDGVETYSHTPIEPGLDFGIRGGRGKKRPVRILIPPQRWRPCERSPIKTVEKAHAMKRVVEFDEPCLELHPE